MLSDEHRCFVSIWDQNKQLNVLEEITKGIAGANFGGMDANEVLDTVCIDRDNCGTATSGGDQVILHDRPDAGRCM